MVIDPDIYQLLLCSWTSSPLYYTIRQPKNHSYLKLGCDIHRDNERKQSCLDFYTFIFYWASFFKPQHLWFSTLSPLATLTQNEFAFMCSIFTHSVEEVLVLGYADKKICMNIYQSDSSYFRGLSLQQTIKFGILVQAWSLCVVLFNT